MREDFLWVERYRPRTIRDTILPEELKVTFQKFVDEGNIPNMLFTGRAGIGKTTVARALLEQIGADYIIINSSMHGNIDTLRTDILNFASTVSFSGGRKYVILDEADYLNPNSTQPALRNFIEQYSKNCGFILTCNFKNKLIEPLWSRCSVVDFVIPKEQRSKMAAAFFKRVKDILTTEGVEYDSKAVVQRYSAIGRIDTGILSNLQEETFKTLVGYLKNKEFTNVRKWVAENADVDQHVFFRKFYDSSYEFMNSSSVAQLVLLLSKYQYQAAFVADQEINMAACLTEVMVECEFK